MEELTAVVARLVLAAAAVALALAVANASTPAPCQAAKLALERPGTELLIYGRFRVEDKGESIWLSCGLAVPRSRILAIERMWGVMRVGSTADGRLYIK